MARRNNNGNDGEAPRRPTAQDGWAGMRPLEPLTNNPRLTLATHPA